MRACLLSSLLLCSSCYRWTPGDAALLASGEAATILDWDQTRTSIGPNCMETNPIIGSCATRTRIDVFFTVAALAQPVVESLLPHGWPRTTLQAFVLGAETSTVWGNWRSGAPW